MFIFSLVEYSTLLTISYSEAECSSTVKLLLGESFSVHWEAVDRVLVLLLGAAWSIWSPLPSSPALFSSVVSVFSSKAEHEIPLQKKNIGSVNKYRQKIFCHSQQGRQLMSFPVLPWKLGSFGKEVYTLRKNLLHWETFFFLNPSP